MKNILIIGLNNKSCNFIKFLKRRGLCDRINGYDFDFDLMKHAIEKRLINNNRLHHIEKIATTSDIIILNIPIEKYDLIFQKFASFLERDCIITNFNTSKKYINKKKKGKLNVREYNFIQSNCLFNIDNPESAINKKVLINSDIKSNLNLIGKLSSFWKKHGFDTENLTITDNDRIMGEILHLPFIFSLLFNNIIQKTFHSSAQKKELELLITLKKRNQFLIEDIFYNKVNTLNLLNRFLSVMNKMTFEGEYSKTFFNKALTARDKKRQIFKFYKIQKSNPKHKNDLIRAINFLLETIFVNDFINPKNYFYLNLNILNFSLETGQEFLCAGIINHNKTKFYSVWNALKQRIEDFCKLLESENSKLETLEQFLLNNAKTN